MKSKKISWVLGGGLLAAFTAGLCCIGPPLFLALGLGSFTAAAFFEVLRPVFLILTAVFLGWAWYTVLQRRKVSCTEDADCQTKPVRPRDIVLLSALTLAVIALAGYPYLLLIGTSATSEVEAASEAPVSGISTVVSVAGMTCPACVIGIEKALKSTDGILDARVVYETKTATVVFDEQVVSKEQIVAVIDNTGFKAVPIEPRDPTLKLLN